MARRRDQWIQAERPALVVLGVARHYGPEYHFTMYGPAWTTGLSDMVGRLRAGGARVLVLGPVPKPRADVPDYLSQHLDDAAACTTPRASAVDAAGVRAERAGGSYLDVSPWICTRSTCAVVVGNLLVYQDDNHLSTSYPAWLAPLLALELDQVLATPTTHP